MTEESASHDENMNLDEAWVMKSYKSKLGCSFPSCFDTSQHGHAQNAWMEAYRAKCDEVTSLKAEGAEAKAVKRIGELEERVKAAEAVGNWALAVKLDGNTREWLLGLEKMVETYNCKYPTSVEAGTEKI